MRIRDLGPLRAEADGEPLPLAGAKQLAVLSLLAIKANQRVSADEIISSAWGDDALVSTSVLENQIWRLRRTLGLSRDGGPGPALVNEFGGYRLVLPARDIDSHHFGELAEAARQHAHGGRFAEALLACDEALALWRGEPYESGAPSPAAEASAARLRELRAEVCELRVDALLATGDTRRALADLQVLTSEYPFRERLWAQRMTGLARAGRTEEALRTYQQVRTLLIDELGLEPGLELRELQRAIVAQDEQPEPATSSMPADSQLRVPEFEPGARGRPLVGRDRELAHIAAAHESGRCGILLVGEVGVGKSALAREALHRLQQQGGCVFRVQATRSAVGIPFGPFADLLPARAVPTDLLASLQEITQALRGQAGARPLVLGIDDAHSLDPASAALVLHLATIGGVFIIATLRSGQPPPDAITALWKDAGARRFEVGPLDEAGSAQLAETLVGGPLETFCPAMAVRHEPRQRAVHQRAGSSRPCRRRVDAD